MKKFIIFISIFLFASDLVIESKNFKYDNKKLISEFVGDVNATKGEDTILCDKMSVYFNKQKKVTLVDAKGNVRFKLKADENTTYAGRGEELKYYVKKGDIILIKGYIKRIETNDTIKGDLIKINKFTKNVDVKGSKNPIKINLKVEN